MTKGSAGATVGYCAVRCSRFAQLITETALDLSDSAVGSSFAWTAWPGARLVNRVAVHGGTTESEFLLFRQNSVAFPLRLGRAAVLNLTQPALVRLRSPRMSFWALGTGA
jgi:hypothetical protein